MSEVYYTSHSLCHGKNYQISKEERFMLCLCKVQCNLPAHLVLSRVSLVVDNLLHGLVPSESRRNVLQNEDRVKKK